MIRRAEIVDVDECISAYNELSADVFATPRRGLPTPFRGKIAPRFDSAKLNGAEKADAKGLLQCYLESDASSRWLPVVEYADDEG